MWQALAKPLIEVGLIFNLPTHPYWRMLIFAQALLLLGSVKTKCDPTAL